ncbi:MAG: sulfatase [Gemmatimonadota bacterium]
MGAWLGLLTGLGELVFLAARKFIKHKFLFGSPDVIWMAPLANAVLFLVAGLLVLGLKAMFPSRITWRTAFGAYLFLASLALLLMYPPLSHLAAALLALGVAVQGGRMAGRASRLIAAMARRMTAPLLVLVVILGVVQHGWYAWTERRMLSALPKSKEGAPNVLLIVLDTVRSLNLSLYGYPKETTPELTRWAARGVRFDRALSTAPWTFPSHATMFTGRMPHELTASWMTPLSDQYPTLSELLGRRGYATAGFAANTLYCSRETGLSRGFSHWADYLISPGEFARSSALGRLLIDNPEYRQLTGNFQTPGRKSAEDVNGEMLEWLGDGKDRPFFVFLNYFDAHGPYLPPAPFDVKFGPAPADRYRRFTERPRRGVPAPDILREEEDAYDASIAYLDHQLGQLFDELERRGQMENTLVVVVSDHGEEFGEHGLMGHGNSLYRPSLQVPLIFWRKNHIPAHRVVTQAVSVRDLAATIMGQVDGPADPAVPGRSLDRFWNGAAPIEGASSDTLVAEVAYTPRLPEWYPVSRGPMKSVVLGEFRYIQNGDGKPELYDFEHDIMETNDLLKPTGQHVMLNELRNLLTRVTGGPGGAR